MKLFMVLLGCKPEARLTEQHDIFFGIGNSLKDLVPDMQSAWPGSGRLHIDGWREVTQVDNYTITIHQRTSETGTSNNGKHLFFINLGGYKPNEFEEFHYKVLAVAGDMQEAGRMSKQTAFYKHTGFENAVAHIDDRYGIDDDDIMNVTEMLDQRYKDKYKIHIEEDTQQPQDELHLGYLPVDRI